VGSDDILPQLCSGEPGEMTNISGRYDDVIPIVRQELSGCGKDHLSIKGMSVHCGTPLLTDLGPKSRRSTDDRRRDGQIVECDLENVEGIETWQQPGKEEFASDFIISDLRDTESVASV